MYCYIVRLACVKPAASVRSEPESNSHVLIRDRSEDLSKLNRLTQTVPSIYRLKGLTKMPILTCVTNYFVTCSQVRFVVECFQSTTHLRLNASSQCHSTEYSRPTWNRSRSNSFSGNRPRCLSFLSKSVTASGAGFYAKPPAPSTTKMIFFHFFFEEHKKPQITALLRREMYHGKLECRHHFLSSTRRQRRSSWYRRCRSRRPRYSKQA
jgi:hypothetical protein